MLGEPTFRAQLSTVDDDGVEHRLTGQGYLLRASARVNLYQLLRYARSADVVDLTDSPAGADCDRCGELVVPNMGGAYISAVPLGGRRRGSCPAAADPFTNHQVDGSPVDLVIQDLMMNGLHS